MTKNPYVLPCLLAVAVTLTSCAGESHGEQETPSYQIPTDPLAHYREQAELAVGENEWLQEYSRMVRRHDWQNECLEAGGFEPFGPIVLDEERSKQRNGGASLPPAEPQLDAVAWAATYGYRKTELWELQYRNNELDRQGFSWSNSDPLTEAGASQAHFDARNNRLFGDPNLMPADAVTFHDDGAMSFDGSKRPDPPEDIRSPEFDQWAQIWGCSAWAGWMESQWQSEAEANPFADPLWVRLEEAQMDSLWSLIADPEVLANRTLWSNCMWEHGFDYAEHGRIYSDIDQELGALRPWMSQESWDGPRDGDGNFIIDEEQLAAVYDFEFAVAVADSTCELAHPYRTLIDQKQFEFTQQLVDENYEALEQWLAEAQHRSE